MLKASKVHQINSFSFAVIEMNVFLWPQFQLFGNGVKVPEIGERTSIHAEIGWTDCLRRTLTQIISVCAFIPKSGKIHWILCIWYILHLCLCCNKHSQYMYSVYHSSIYSSCQIAAYHTTIITKSITIICQRKHTRRNHIE